MDGIASLVLIVNNFLSYSGMEMNADSLKAALGPRSEQYVRVEDIRRRHRGWRLAPEQHQSREMHFVS